MLTLTSLRISLRWEQAGSSRSSFAGWGETGFAGSSGSGFAGSGESGFAGSSGAGLAGSKLVAVDMTLPVADNQDSL